MIDVEKICNQTYDDIRLGVLNKDEFTQMFYVLFNKTRINGYVRGMMRMWNRLRRRRALKAQDKIKSMELIFERDGLQFPDISKPIPSNTIIPLWNGDVKDIQNCVVGDLIRNSMGFKKEIVYISPREVDGLVKSYIIKLK